MSAVLIDLDASRREIQHPDGIPVRLGGEVFTFPAELPLQALDPLLDENLDLMGIVARVVADDGNDNVIGTVVDLLLARPHLPKAFLNAFLNIYRALLNEQYETFIEQRPTIPDFIRLSKSLLALYAVSPGKLFGSPASPETGGPTSNTTSPSITGETPETSGADPVTPPSSESVD